MENSVFSAFGAMHPVHDRAGKRVRWFCPWPITDQQSIQRVLDELSDLETLDSVTRLTVRVLSFSQLSPLHINLFAERGYQTEALIQLAGTTNPVITYLGKCKPGRQANEIDARQERALIRKIESTPPKGPQRIARQFAQSGNFKLEKIRSGMLSTADRDQLIAMHQQVFPTFPYDFDSKLELMIKAPETYLMVAARSLTDGEIYSFSNLEINNLVLEGGHRFRFAEFDNSMSRKPGKDHGEVSALGSSVRLELARMAHQKQVDLCHSESRAGLIAINEISHQIGMRFGGALQRHLLISGKNDIDYQSPSNFETMNVWFLNSQDLALMEQACLQSTDKA